MDYNMMVIVHFKLGWELFGIRRATVPRFEQLLVNEYGHTSYISEATETC